MLNSMYCIAEEVNYSSPEQCIKASLLCKSLSIKGEFYKVIDAVYRQDFKSVMENELGKMNAPNLNKVDQNYRMDLTKIDSYEFSIEKDEKQNKYYIGVGPALRPGGRVFFGSFHYILDATTLNILDKYQKP
ncbi:hypothetical protein MGMO_83c00030 [Methyloglobulus morosus KoM1]|uniref:Uncharacterized protein n=2 Tax=Methyloglobulus TaxID=1410680 RepID=V5BF55_9GAMM|nr:hypothetical protein MGMO_83c00030 [Methyloglobulus morosus KoM1]